MLKVDQITGDCAEQLKFPGSAANANCALRTLRRMLHKAGEWKVIGHAPKIKMMKEHGRHLLLDDEAERELMAGASACNWRPRTRELFRDIVILMRETGVRNERELFRMRIDKLDWQNTVLQPLDCHAAEFFRIPTHSFLCHLQFVSLHSVPFLSVSFVGVTPDLRKQWVFHARRLMECKAICLRLYPSQNEASPVAIIWIILLSLGSRSSSAIVSALFRWRRIQVSPGAGVLANVRVFEDHSSIQQLWTTRGRCS